MRRYWKQSCNADRKCANDKALRDKCTSILNLAVSGASIEDHFALVYLALQNGRPKKIVLGIDPWTLAFEKDARWSYYTGDYQQARDVILGDVSRAKGDDTNKLRGKLRNLLSLEYTIRSAATAALDMSVGYSPRPAPEPDEGQGGEYKVLYPDGSVQYSAEFLAIARTQTVPFHGDYYKTGGIINDAAAIDAYRSLLRWIKSKGVEPILLMAPYHPNVWNDSANSRPLVVAERIINQLASDLRLSIVGSYSPDIAGCLKTEYFDFMHPTASCMAKLRQR